jgi:serine/threonine protein kinase
VSLYDPPVTPRLPGRKRNGPTFEAEADVHAELSELALIASLLDWGEETVDFDGTEIDCWWVEMEFVEGRLLADVIEEGPRSLRQAAQIAWDLLEFVDLMRKRGSHHNDLHAENVMVVDLDDSRSRRRAIDPHAAVRILDLGSAASRSVEGDGDSATLSGLLQGPCSPARDTGSHSARSAEAESEATALAVAVGVGTAWLAFTNWAAIKSR